MIWADIVRNGANTDGYGGVSASEKGFLSKQARSITPHVELSLKNKSVVTTYAQVTTFKRFLKWGRKSVSFLTQPIFGKKGVPNIVLTFSSFVGFLDGAKTVKIGDESEDGVFYD